MGRHKAEEVFALGQQISMRWRHAGGTRSICSMTNPEPFWPHYQQFLKHSGELQSFTTDAYMGMIRNLQRYGWLILYLFGSSPVVSKSFIDSRKSAYSDTLEKFDETSYYKPYATSLRMSEIGYVNPVQSMFHISFNSLDDYGYYYLGVQYDITKQVVAEQEIKRLNDRLEILAK